MEVRVRVKRVAASSHISDIGTFKMPERSGMDITSASLLPVHAALRSVLVHIKELPVTEENQQEMIDLLAEMEKEDIDITKRRKAYAELEDKEEKVGDKPEQIEKTVLKMMKEMADSESQLGIDARTERERFEKGPEEEDEIEVESATYSKKDPITKEDIKNPVKNSRCGHVYDRDSVEEYIQMNRRNKMAFYQCPVQGCANKANLAVHDLIDFPDFFKYCK